MKFRKHPTFVCNPDMTPMIDLTFQLTFFFMLSLNFSSDVQSDLVRLPLSDIAKPVEGTVESPITVQALSSGVVLFGGDRMSAQALRGPLQHEQAVLASLTGRQRHGGTIVIRADRDVPGGKVQEVIRVCQDAGFEKFVLRARPKQ